MPVRSRVIIVVGWTWARSLTPRNGAGRLDNGDTALKSVRHVRDDFDWGDDRSPGIPWDQTVIYELHVRGFTKLHEGVPEAKRGTYAAMAEPVVTDYLRELGVTSVQLLPTCTRTWMMGLVHRGLTNYWGYNTIGFSLRRIRSGQ